MESIGYLRLQFGPQVVRALMGWPPPHVPWVVRVERATDLKWKLTPRLEPQDHHIASQPQNLRFLKKAYSGEHRRHLYFPLLLVFMYSEGVFLLEVEVFPLEPHSCHSPSVSVSCLDGCLLPGQHPTGLLFSTQDSSAPPQTTDFLGKPTMHEWGSYDPAKGLESWLKTYSLK